MRWLNNFYDFRFKWTATAAIGIHPTKAWLSQLVNFKNAIWTGRHFRRTICHEIVLNLQKFHRNVWKASDCFSTSLHEWCISGIRDSRKAGNLWWMMRGVGGVRKSIHHSWLAKGLGLLCWGFKGVQEEIPWEEVSTLEIGSVAFPPGQYTSPQLHPCHRLFDLDWHQDSSLAFLYSRPCSPWLLVIPWAQRLSLWDNWGYERGCDEGHWHAHARGLPWSVSEVVGTVQAHCSRRRLLRKGLEFHVCTINKSTHMKKNLETFLMILVFNTEVISVEEQ